LSNAGGNEVFIAKLNSSGKCLWSKSAGDSGNDYGKGVAVDGADNVLVTGSFTNAIDFGGCPLSNAGGSELFVAKLDTSGKCIWSKSAGGTTKVPPCIAADGAGNVLVTGSFADAMDFGGCPLSKAGVVDPFLAKLDPSGKCLWRAGVGAADDPQYGGAIAVDNTGNVLLVGGFSGSVDFGGGAFVSAGGNDLFLLKLDAAGEHLWSRRAGSPLNDAVNGVAVDSVGNILVIGYFNGTVDFGTGPLVSEGAADVFVAKFGP
jgi:hypothetical protein